MLTVYLVCLLIGGTLVAGSALFGGHGHDGDHGELDHSDHFESGHHDGLEHDELAPASGSFSSAVVHAETAHVGMQDIGGDHLWLPFLSMRFWTFFLAFFGLTGVVLTGLALWTSQAAILPASVVMGLISGYGVAAVMNHLRRTTTDSSIQEQDYLGASARVLLPIAQGQPGKVRLQIRDQTVDLIAETEDPTPLALRQEVLVYAIENGILKVTGPNRRQLSAPV